MSRRANTIATIVSVFALAVSGASFWRSCRQDSKLEELSYDTQGLKHRPRIEFEMPEKFDFTARLMEPLPNDLPKSEALKTNLTIKAQIKGVNNSDYVARVVAVATIDRPTGMPELREMLLDENKRAKLRFLPNQDYYKSLEILPHKEYTFDVSRELSSADRKKKSS